MGTDLLHNVKNDELDIVLKDNAFVVVDFWAPWCGPCKMLAPIFEEVGKNMEAINVKCVKVNVDENQNTAQKYNIQTIPTILFFQNQKLVHTVVGIKDVTFLTAEIKKQFNIA